MDLKTFQQENAELWSAVQEWIRDGWGVGDEIEISPLMVAAALEKEAVTQDSCVAARDSDASYPIRLRQLASQLARTASIELGGRPLNGPSGNSEIPMKTTKQALTVTTGWGQGRKARFVGFADGERGLAITNVGPSTTVISGVPGRGDAIVEMDGKQYGCWFRNLDPFPAQVIVVHVDLCSCDDLDQVEDLPKIADLGVRFFPKDHKVVCSRLKRMVAKHGEFAWVHYGYKSPVLVVGVTPR